jgi:hypothetical protein
MTDVPHTQQGDRELEIDAAGADTGARPHVNPIGATRQPRQGSLIIETERFTAAQLGIPMPSLTAWPAATAFGIVVMLSGLLFAHRDDKTLFFTFVFSGATILVGSLYAWLTSPLEEHH